MFLFRCSSSSFRTNSNICCHVLVKISIDIVSLQEPYLIWTENTFLKNREIFSFRQKYLILKNLIFRPSEDAEKIGPAVPQPTQEPPQAKESPIPSNLPPQPPPVSKPPAKPESKPIANPEKTITIEPPTQPIRSAQPPPAPTPTPPAPALLPPPPFMGRPGGPPIPPPPGPPRMGMVRPPMMPPRMMMPPQNMNQQRPRFIPPPIPPPSDEPPTIILPPPIEEEEDEPVFKKSKIESLEADLLPEDLFLETNRLPVTFRVQVPDLPDKPEWQCQGQVLTITLPLKDQVSSSTSYLVCFNWGLTEEIIPLVKSVGQHKWSPCKKEKFESLHPLLLYSKYKTQKSSVR